VAPRQAASSDTKSASATKSAIAAAEVLFA
jgi:hypothetical protein